MEDTKKRESHGSDSGLQWFSALLPKPIIKGLLLLGLRVGYSKMAIPWHINYLKLHEKR